MASITHSVVATGTDDPDKQVSKDAWNAEHVIDLAIADVDGLQAALDSKQATGDYATATMLGSYPTTVAMNAALALKASLSGPAFTDVPTAPTALTPTSTTQIATTAFVQAVATNLIDTTLAGDVAFAATMTTQLSGKQDIDADLTSWAGVTRASGFDTFAATPSSANLRALVTDESGTGALLFAGGAFGTPSSLVLTNATGLPVAGGGTGRATSTTAYGLIAAGTTATGAHQTLAAGATTEILVGGGAAALPVWTTATGSGAPVRATSPTLVTPALGTPSALNLTNATALPATSITSSTTAGRALLTAADAQAQRVLLRSSCKALRTTSLTGLNFTAGLNITWNTEGFDDSAWHDAVTNTERMTVPTGVDRVNGVASIRMANITAALNLVVSVTKNAGATIIAQVSTAAATTAPALQVPFTDSCTAGDYYIVNVFVNDAAADLVADGTFFFIEAA